MCLWRLGQSLADVVTSATGQIPSRSVGSVSCVSRCLVASGLQIGLQNGLLVCGSPIPPALPQLSASLAFVWNFWPGYLDHRDKVFQACEIVGIRRVQRKLSCDRGRGDHKIDRPAAGLPARAYHSCRNPAVGTGGVRVEGDRIELVLRPLQYIQPASPLGSLEVGVLFGVRAYLMQSGGQLGAARREALARPGGQRRRL